MAPSTRCISAADRRRRRARMRRLRCTAFGPATGVEIDGVGRGSGVPVRLVQHLARVEARPIRALRSSATANRSNCTAVRRNGPRTLADGWNEGERQRGESNCCCCAYSMPPVVAEHGLCGAGRAPRFRERDGGSGPAPGQGAWAGEPAPPGLGESSAARGRALAVSAARAPPPRHPARLPRARSRGRASPRPPA